MHAGWGHPNGRQRGQIEFPVGQAAGRRMMRDCIGFVSRLESPSGRCSHLENVRTSLWSELTVPAATSAEGASTESGIFWNCMIRHNPGLAQRVEEFLREAAGNERDRRASREDFAKRATPSFAGSWMQPWFGRCPRCSSTQNSRWTMRRVTIFKLGPPSWRR